MDQKLIERFEQLLNGDGLSLDEIASKLNISMTVMYEILDYLDEMSYDDSMDGDAASALASAGWGTDEDYGYDMEF